MLALTSELLDPNLPKKGYSFKPTNDSIQAIEKAIEGNKFSLENDDPNEFEDKINVKAARVSRPAKETFASEKAIIDLHLDLYKGDKTSEYERITEDVEKFISKDVEKIVAATVQNSSA